MSKLPCDKAPPVTAASRPCDGHRQVDHVLAEGEVDDGVVCGAGRIGSRRVEEAVGSPAPGEHVGATAALKQVPGLAADEQVAIRTAFEHEVRARLGGPVEGKMIAGAERPTGDGERVPGFDHAIGRREVVIGSVRNHEICRSRRRERYGRYR